jgi:hypothetical protein
VTGLFSLASRYIAVTCNSALRTGIGNISGFLVLQFFSENLLEPE